MVKNSKKPKNHAQPATLPPSRQSNKYAPMKTAKKSEKTKVMSSASSSIKGLPKPKQQQQQQQQSIEGPDSPCTSKQAICPTNGNFIRPKTPSKSPWGGIWKRIDKKKEISALTSRKHIRQTRKFSPATDPITTSPALLQTSDRDRQSPAEDNTTSMTAFEEAEIASLLQSGIVRYSDVVRSKNVSSSASLKPPPIIKLPISTSPSLIGAQIGNQKGTTTNEVAAIDLEYFPELGQHKTWQSTSTAGSSSCAGNSSGNNRYSRKTTLIGNDDKSIQLCSPESPNAKSKCSDINKIKESNSNELNENLNTNNSSNHNSTSPLCQQCQLNAEWLERVIQNSAKPFHINIAEFNFLQPDIAYPRFLMQFEDENYLKAENMALLGLKLALGGSFHRQHANCK